MPQPIQQGTVADRLRNFLRLSGRIPVQLDENVVPIVNVQDLSQPPWRTQDVDFGVNVNGAAVAAVNTHVGLEVPVGIPGVAVVDTIYFQNSTGAAVAYSITVGVRVGAGYTLQGTCYNTELIDPGSAGAAIATVPVEFFDFSTAPIVGQEICRVMVPIGGSVIIPTRVSLRGRYGSSADIGQCLMVANRTVNLAANVSFRGTYYPQAL